MEKMAAQKLELYIKKTEKAFSNKEREFNHSNETFVFKKKAILSHTAVAILFKKLPSEKYAIMFAYWRRDRGGHWEGWFPKGTHVQAMKNFEEYYLKVEESNYPKNLINGANDANEEDF